MHFYTYDSKHKLMSLKDQLTYEFKSTFGSDILAAQLTAIIPYSTGTLSGTAGDYKDYYFVFKKNVEMPLGTWYGSNSDTFTVEFWFMFPTPYTGASTIGFFIT